MRAIRTGLAVVIVTSLLAASGVAATAHDEACVQRAWDVPMESITLPKGFEWDDLSVSPDRLVGFVQASTGDPLFGPSITLSVICVHDPTAMMARSESLRDFAGITKDMDVPARLGADAIAYKVTDKRALNRGDMAIQWPRGDLFAEVESMDFKDFDVLARFAVALDAVLPEGASEPAN